MLKLKKCLFYIFIMFISFFMFDGINAIAEEATEENDLVNRIVLNANSEGALSNVYDGVQYTRARDITVAINLTEDELVEFADDFDLCEVIPASTADNVREQEICATYDVGDQNISFQLRGRKDGEKELRIYFYKGDASHGKMAPISKKIVLDTIGPSITLTGGEYIYLLQGQKYEELGATCEDNSGVASEACVVTIENVSIDMNKSEYQYIRYTASDFLGNEVNVVRKIMVEIPKKKPNYSYWIYAGGLVLIIAGFLGYKVIKNKEKQKNQSVL